VTLFQITILALIQGITEFLPISSSGHLVLLPTLTGWEDQGLVMDVAVHVGTLGAVMLYFWRDVWRMLVGIVKLFTGRLDAGAKLALYIIVATIPVIGAGFALKESVHMDLLRSAEIIGWTTLGFGLLLWVADRSGMTVRRVEHMGWGSAIAIGLAQVLALIPGTSRSGITMTAARFMGFERPDAARFSMLLSIPVILGAGVLAGKDVIDAGDPVMTGNVLLGAGLAFASALVAIAVMMSWLKSAGFGIFVLYRVALGVGLLTWVYMYGGGA
jgi:undecaprenyl-diphosphatase